MTRLAPAQACFNCVRLSQCAYRPRRHAGGCKTTRREKSDKARPPETRPPRPATAHLSDDRELSEAAGKRSTQGRLSTGAGRLGLEPTLAGPGWKPARRMVTKRASVEERRPAGEHRTATARACVLTWLTVRSAQHACARLPAPSTHSQGHRLMSSPCHANSICAPGQADSCRPCPRRRPGRAGGGLRRRWRRSDSFARTPLAPPSPALRNLWLPYGARSTIMLRRRIRHCTHVLSSTTPGTAALHRCVHHGWCVPVVRARRIGLCSRQLPAWGCKRAAAGAHLQTQAR